MILGIQAYGTDGDIELFAIAYELSKEVHEVYLNILRFEDRKYQFLHETKDIHLRVIKFPKHEFESNNENLNVEIWKNDKLSTLHFLHARFQFIAPLLSDSAKELCSLCDVVLGTQHTIFLRNYAEKYNKLYFSLSHEHSLIRSKYLAPPGQSNEGIRNNQLLWNQVEKEYDKIFLILTNNIRANIGLATVINALKENCNYEELTLLRKNTTNYHRKYNLDGYK